MKIRLASKELEATSGIPLVKESQRRKLRRKDLHDWYEADEGVGWVEQKFPCHCGLTRACALCRGRWVKVARERILAWFEPRKNHAKFLTLTSTYVAKIEQLTELMDKAVELCSWHWKKNFVLIGEFLEKGDLWYCNLHAIVVGDYVPQKQISAEWMGLTGDSYVVDIRKVKPEEKRFAIAYITKYLTKPLENMARQEPRRVVEATKGLYHRRLLRAHGFKKAVREDRVPVAPVGSSSDFTCSQGIIPLENPRYWVFLGYEMPVETVETVEGSDLMEMPG